MIAEWTLEFRGADIGGRSCFPVDKQGSSEKRTSQGLKEVLLEDKFVLKAN